MTATINACAAGKYGNGGAGIDNDRLTLGGVAYPKIHVVGAVALVECADLLFEIGVRE